MLNIRCELRYESQVPGLAGRPVCEAGQSRCEGFVVRVSGERSALQELSEVAYCRVETEELAVKGTVLGLGRGELPREERDGFPRLPVALLEFAADVRVGGIDRDAGG